MKEQTRSRRLAVAIAISLSAASAPAPAAAKTYAPDTLIVPMDTTFQDQGMFLAFGLVHDLLRAGVPVDWAIGPGKTYGDADFHAFAADVLTSAPIVDHGYRGGPFVIDAASFAAALPRVQAWQAAHPEVAVHRATAAFSADAALELRFAPDVAVLVAGGEADTFAYLNAAGIPMSDGAPWPQEADRSGAYECPGPYCCPDCFGLERLAGDDSGLQGDGALFDEKGVPRYCHVVVNEVPSSTIDTELVAEVRSFLEYPVSFFAGSRAVPAFENDPQGRFLTSGGLEAQGPPPRVAYAGSDDPTAQADGEFQNSGSAVGSFALAAGSAYCDATFPRVFEAGAEPGTRDVLIGGHLLGNPAKGKITYLGGKAYEVKLPISDEPKSQGTRYFLDSVFAAPCAAASSAPHPIATLDGAPATSSGTYAFRACYGNEGTGIAFDAELEVYVPEDAAIVSASEGATVSENVVAWALGSLPPGEGGCLDVTVSLPAEGSYAFDAAVTYRVGMNEATAAAPEPLVVRFGRVSLLRYGGLTSLSPWSPAPASVFTGAYPDDPTLDPARDLEVVAFASGAAFPHEGSDLGAGSPPLVLYQLEGSAGNTLRLSKEDGKLVARF